MRHLESLNDPPGPPPPPLAYHELSNLFPLLDEDAEEFVALLEDMRANRQVEPIVIYENKVLEGRHRYRVCLKLGIEPKFTPPRQTEGWTRDKAAAFVWSKNWPRRHLTRAWWMQRRGRIRPASGRY